jgi:UDP-N-acetylmuramyl pentapeptide phosphotransferase/UDP-N-acetylglucosamine-1-phosphate transferase
MRPERVLRLAVFFFLGYLALSFVAGVFVAEATIHPSRRLVSATDEMRAEEMAHSHDYQLADVHIAARDGVTLSAWTIRPGTATGRPSSCCTVSVTTGWV